MTIDIKEYILNEIGHTNWHGETNYDNESYENLQKLDNYLYELEDIRSSLLNLLTEHNDNSNKGNFSKDMLKQKAKNIMKRHIIQEFTFIDFDKFWGDIDEC